MVWMNVDKPEKKCSIHADDRCFYVKNMKETKYKGVIELKRDGGWLIFPNIREAKEHFLAKYDHYQLVEHCASDMDIEQKKTFNREPNEPEIAPFNNATQHYQKIIGLTSSRVNPTHLPKWLQVFYFSFMVFVFIGSIFILYAFIFK